MKNAQIRIIFVILIITIHVQFINAQDACITKRAVDDIKEGTLIVIHIVVSLCDNKYQGIVPVSEELGNGQNPAINLYWGAMYGVKNYLPRKAGWKICSKAEDLREEILEKIVLYKQIENANVYIVAEAWNGKNIKESVQHYVDLSYGIHPEKVATKHNNKSINLMAGGSAHLIIYVGHNGLMDFKLGKIPEKNINAPERSSAVFACLSKKYFQKIIQKSGAKPYIFTNSFMAPEAYVIDAAISAWVKGKDPNGAVDAVAKAYSKYQKCSVKSAEKLFYCEAY